MKATDNIYRLAYASLRAHGLGDDEVVDDIVLPAITKNRRLQISGRLWFDERRFLQVLEGTEETVTQLFGVIREDARHTAVEVLSAHAVERCLFARFSMRFLGPDAPSSIVELLPPGVVVPAADRFAPDHLLRLADRVIADLSEWMVPPGNSAAPA